MSRSPNGVTLVYETESLFLRHFTRAGARAALEIGHLRGLPVGDEVLGELNRRRQALVPHRVVHDQVFPGQGDVELEVERVRPFAAGAARGQGVASFVVELPDAGEIGVRGQERRGRERCDHQRGGHEGRTPRPLEPGGRSTWGGCGLVFS